MGNSEEHENPVQISLSQWIYGTDSETQKQVYDDIFAQFRDQTGIKIDYSLRPATGYRPWLIARFEAGNAPDLITSRVEWSSVDLAKGLIQDLSSYVQQSFEYGEGLWVNQILPWLLQQCYDKEGRLTSVPTMDINIKVYFNQNHFANFGMNIPQTWDEFMVLNQQLSQANQIPFAVSNDGTSAVFVWILTQLIKSHKATLLAMDTDESGYIEVRELAEGFLNGSMRFQNFRDEFDQIFEFSRYWYSGSGESNDQVVFDAWLNGEVSMVMGGNWELLNIERMKRNDFHYGVFFPSGCPRGTNCSRKNPRSLVYHQFSDKGSSA